MESTEALYHTRHPLEENCFIDEAEPDHIIGKDDEPEEKSSDAVCSDRWEGSESAQALKALKQEPTSFNLWRCICLHAGMQLRTSGRGSKPGIDFSYSISSPGGGAGRHYQGESVDGFGNEMMILLPSGEKKKTISRSTVDLALKNALAAEGCIRGPRALNIPGAHSYLYPILVRFGVIRESSIA